MEREEAGWETGSGKGEWMERGEDLDRSELFPSLLLLHVEKDRTLMFLPSSPQLIRHTSSYPLDVSATEQVRTHHLPHHPFPLSPPSLPPPLSSSLPSFNTRIHHSLLPRPHLSSLLSPLHHLPSPLPPPPETRPNTKNRGEEGGEEPGEVEVGSSVVCEGKPSFLHLSFSCWLYLSGRGSW